MLYVMKHQELTSKTRHSDAQNPNLHEKNHEEIFEETASRLAELFYEQYKQRSVGRRESYNNRLTSRPILR